MHYPLLYLATSVLCGHTLSTISRAPVQNPSEAMTSQGELSLGHGHKHKHDHHQKHDHDHGPHHHPKNRHHHHRRHPDSKDADSDDQHHPNSDDQKQYDSHEDDHDHDGNDSHGEDFDPSNDRHHESSDDKNRNHSHGDLRAKSWVGPDGRLYHSHDGLAPHTHEPIYSPGYFSRRAPPLITRNFHERAFTVGIGGPVGTGKTALMLALCQCLRENYSLAAVTNDIFTKEDGEFLVKHGALPEERIRAVETGGCPHAAIREDISINLGPLEELSNLFKADILLCESGGDNLAANFSRELADYIIYIIDVSGGDKIPRKGGPGITQADLLVINKTDLAPAIGADLRVMERDALRMRDGGPFVFAQVKHGVGIEEIVGHVLYAWEVATGEKRR